MTMLSYYYGVHTGDVGKNDACRMWLCKMRISAERWVQGWRLHGLQLRTVVCHCLMRHFSELSSFCYPFSVKRWDPNQDVNACVSTSKPAPTLTVVENVLSRFAICLESIIFLSAIITFWLQTTKQQETFNFMLPKAYSDFCRLAGKYF